MSFSTKKDNYNKMKITLVAIAMLVSISICVGIVYRLIPDTTNTTSQQDDVTNQEVDSKTDSEYSDSYINYVDDSKTVEQYDGQIAEDESTNSLEFNNEQFRIPEGEQ